MLSNHQSNPPSHTVYSPATEQKKFDDLVAYIERVTRDSNARKILEVFYDIASEKAAIDRARYATEMLAFPEKEARRQGLLGTIRELIKPLTPPLKPSPADSQYATRAEFAQKARADWADPAQEAVINQLMNAHLIREVTQGGNQYGGGVSLGIGINPHSFAAVERVLLSVRALEAHGS